VGFIAGWATVLDYVVSISLAALFLPHYVLGAIGQDTLSADQSELLAVLLILVITAARIARRTNVYMAGVVLAVLDLVVQAGLGLMGLMLLFDWTALTNNIDLGTKPTWNSLAFALPIAMIGFTGLEKVTGLVGLAKRPEKSVPDSIRSSVFTVILVYAAVATAAISAFPSHRAPAAPAGYASELTTRWLDAPMLGLATAVGNEFGSTAATAARFIVGVTASLILLLAITTSFSGAGRLSVAMGERLELPGPFAKRNRRSLQPTFALIGVGLLASASVIVAARFQGEEVLSLA
jgi:basic amino acid/polyamine antiporter, APA family